MNKLLVTMTMIAFFAATFGLAMAVSSDATGPAPNSGDGIPDGSGMDPEPSANGSTATDNGQTDPAPNSGDGIPDGNGMDSPSGPHSEGPAQSSKGNSSKGNGPNSHGSGDDHRR